MHGRMDTQSTDFGLGSAGLRSMPQGRTEYEFIRIPPDSQMPPRGGTHRILMCGSAGNLLIDIYQAKVAKLVHSIDVPRRSSGLEPNPQSPMTHNQRERESSLKGRGGSSLRSDEWETH
ncbi:hypothetical protein ACOME3_009826 [Neoechinorhynchus agilis]